MWLVGALKPGDGDPDGKAFGPLEKFVMNSFSSTRLEVEVSSKIQDKSECRISPTYCLLCADSLGV
jgi:hypothetical protein